MVGDYLRRYYLLLILGVVYFHVVVSRSGSYAADDHKKPLCSPDNLPLQNTSMGNFYLMPDGSFKYYLPHCKLRRFKVREVAKCLQGNHIVFMGDSLSRYFYLNLAGFLAQGHWPLHFIDQYPEGRGFLSEKEYHSWTWFYQDTNRALNRGKHAIEICDCFRNDSLSFEEFIREMFENRHFRYTPDGDLDNTQNDVRLSYIQWWGLMPMRGHRSISLQVPRSKQSTALLDKWNRELCPDEPESFWPLSRNCSNQRKDLRDIDFVDFSYKEICENFPAPTLNPHTKTEICQRFEREILGPMGATHLLLNSGWHAGLEHVGPNFLPKVIAAADRYFVKPPSDSHIQHTLPKVTWRQTTAGGVFEGNDCIAKNISDRVSPNRFGYFPVGDITSKLRKLRDLMNSNNLLWLRKMVKKHPTWPAGRDVNLTTVHGIWHDAAHFEPYVYTEINNIFLNAICPLAD